MVRTSSRKPGRHVATPAHPVSLRPAILLVDGEAVLRMALSGFLQECGFKVFEAGSADEVITILSQGTVRIDIVLSAVKLPGETDGFALANWVAANRRDLKVILAAGDRSKISHAQQLCGGEPFYSRPYDLRAAVAGLRANLRARASRNPTE